MFDCISLFIKLMEKVYEPPTCFSLADLYDIHKLTKEAGSLL